MLVFTLGAALHAYAQNTWVRVHGGSLEPDSKVVTELKAGLERYVKVAARGQRQELRNWAEYVFQYLGQEENGRKYVLVNAICRREPGWNLEKRLVFVFDGGPCFFTPRFDPKRKRYYDLAINGYAQWRPRSGPAPWLPIQPSLCLMSFVGKAFAGNVRPQRGYLRRRPPWNVAHTHHPSHR